MRSSWLILPCLLLTACGTVNRDVSYIATDYDSAEKSVDVSVESADGGVTLKVRRHPLQKKILVLLDTGSIKRAMEKDLGAKNTALPQSFFEAAANKRLVEVEGPTCHTATAMMRQDYMWEFDYVCKVTQTEHTKRSHITRQFRSHSPNSIRSTRSE